MSKIIETKQIISNEFKTIKEFREQYKEVKKDFYNQLGVEYMPQGFITLKAVINNKHISITSYSKKDMEEYINKNLYKSYIIEIPSLILRVK